VRHGTQIPAKVSGHKNTYQLAIKSLMSIPALLCSAPFPARSGGENTILAVEERRLLVVLAGLLWNVLPLNAEQEIS
ncbi:hypothetical protein KI387_001437, partial [Taxus chinensis]